MRGGLLLYSGNTSLGWRVVRRTSFAAGEQRVAHGAFRRVYDPVTSEHIGYQLVEDPHVDRDLPSIRSSSAISLMEMQRNVERSRTEGLPEHRRAERAAAGLVPEDVVERVHAKVRVFRQVGAAKQDILRAWPL